MSSLAVSSSDLRSRLLELLADHRLSVADVLKAAGITRPEWNLLLKKDQTFRSSYHQLRVPNKPTDTNTTPVGLSVSFRGDGCWMGGAAASYTPSWPRPTEDGW